MKFANDIVKIEELGRESTTNCKHDMFVMSTLNPLQPAPIYYNLCKLANCCSNLF